jgi:phosphoglycerate dehydrogenase-like enzyme
MWIVNCARGGVIDEVALAIDSGKVLFAGLDVLKMSQVLKCLF